MFKLLATLAALLASASLARGQTIYPLDHAEILAGARFDMKVELPLAIGGPDGLEVMINGKPAAEVLGIRPSIIANEDGAGHSAWWIRDGALARAGRYLVEARSGPHRTTVRWEVFDTPAAKAQNVILFIADGMSNAHRVAARILARGMRQGRYGGELAIDDMPNMALVSTAGTDSIITDSANSMTAYTTGHKTCVNALGVYCALNKDNLAHPRVETIASIARRVAGKAIGIVTNTAIADATPAGVIAHTRSRFDFSRIVEMYFKARPEVLLGGGSAHFLPAPAGRRADGLNYITRFEEAGYRIAATAPELAKLASQPETRRLLGLFHTRAMDGALDRRFLKKGTVAQFPSQPDLTEQLEAALAVLSRHDKGFFLAVESGLIDRYSHVLDWERAVYDVIMLDNAVAMAKTWAARRGNDTLIVVVADHTHPVSIIGTYDDTRPGDAMREKLDVYQRAGFPDYPAPGPDGYPPGLDAKRRLAFTFAAFPDHCDTARPFAGPALKGARSQACSGTGAPRRIGNLPSRAASGVHSAEDVVLTAIGPGADAFRGRIDNTRVFRAIVSAMGLGR